MLKEIISNLTEGNKQYIFDVLPSFQSNNTMYFYIDLEKPLKEQSFDNMMEYLIYDLELRKYLPSNLENHTTILEYLKYKHHGKKIEKLEPTKNFKTGLKNLGKTELDPTSVMYNFLDFKLKEKVLFFNKLNTPDENLEFSKNYLKENYNILGGYEKRLEETKTIFEKVKEIILTKNKASFKKLSDEEQDTIFKNTYDVDYFTSEQRLKNIQKIQTYLAENEEAFYDLLAFAMPKFFEKYGAVSKDFQPEIMIIFNTNLDDVRKEYVEYSYLTSYNTSNNFKVVDNQVYFNTLIEIFESDKKPSLINYMVGNCKKDVSFSYQTKKESLNYFIFISMLKKTTRNLTLNNDYGKGIYAILFKDSPSTASENMNNIYQNGTLLIFQKDTHSHFSSLETVIFNPVVKDEKPVIFEEIVYETVEVEEKNKKKKSEDTTTKTKMLRKTTVLTNKTEKIDLVNKYLFKKKLLNRTRNAEAVQYAFRCLNGLADSNFTSFNKDIYNYDVDKITKKYYNVYIKSLELLSEDLMNKRADLEIYECNMLYNSIMFTNALTEGSLDVLNKQEQNELKEAYANQTLKLDKKKYLFIAGNLAKIIYNASKSNTKMQMIKRLYNSKTFIDFSDLLTDYFMKYESVIEYSGKYESLLKILNDYALDNKESLKKERINKEDKLTFMQGYLSDTNLIYVKVEKLESGKNNE